MPVLAIVAALLIGRFDAVSVMASAAVSLAGAVKAFDGRFRRQVAAVPADLDGYILYLRSFRSEDEGKFDPASSDGRSAACLCDWRSPVPLDAFIASEALRWIGPVVGLGDPADRVPPTGAVRVYLDHHDWQDELGRLADRSAAIVMTPSSTQALRWELRHIYEKQLWDKFFIITSNTRMRYADDSPVGRFINFVRGEDVVSWSEFVEEVRLAGLDMPGSDPGAGAVIGFNGDGSSVLLLARLRSPTEVVATMRTWISEVSQQGR